MNIDAAPRQPLSTIRQLELMRQLQRVANDRAKEEARIRDALASGLAAAREARNKAAAENEQEYAESHDQLTHAYEESTSTARAQYESQRDAFQQQYQGLRRGVELEHSRATEDAHSEQKESSWETATVYEAIKDRPKERLGEAVRQLERRTQELAVLEQDAATIMKMRRQWREFPPIDSSRGLGNVAGGPADEANGRANRASSGAPAKVRRVVLGRPAADTRAQAEEHDADPVDRAIARVDELTIAVRQSAIALNDQRLPRIFEGGYPLGVFLAAWLIAALPAALLLDWRSWPWIAASLAMASLVTVAVLGWLWPRARQQSGAQFQLVRERLVAARQAVATAMEEARQRARREAGALVAERDAQLAAVEQKLHAIVDEKERWKQTEMGRAGQLFPSRLAELRVDLEEILSAARIRLSEALASQTEQRDRTAAEIDRQHELRAGELQAEHDQAWEALTRGWHRNIAMIGDAWADMLAQCERLFPDWNSVDFTSWPRPADPPPSIRFGEVTLDLANIKHGIPRDERLRPPQPVFQLPALMTLEEHPILLVTADEQGRRQAVDVLQLAMLRMLTAMPPGKVRFTILDPVGLGENFASFMHLADFDEQLIASRIWTESRQIEEQLTRLTAHMETVLQKYLRNEFATIDDYNATAGEVAEPFQVLVVANFPTNFSEAAARKLVSIATSGPRCGVYTLLSVDRKQRLPNDFDLQDLSAAAVHLDWQAGPAGSDSPGRFRWRYPAFEHLPLALDRPPVAEKFNEVVRLAGRAAKESMKVEVPFEMVAPAADALWQGVSGKELVVPIGRAGAKRLQEVRLGRGTSQHLLVCGKTGSGKSTFLHALITNAALIYSPDEVEFYLIDFKKGVEFKTYATHRLPHARVIAIESEREFGLSVLERLDAELRRRGDLFRAAGVQDLGDFRAARPGERMPRVLLVVDEFQELFVEDDKLSQEAALLLDRLVRQGRAFGVHVLLGSQTLSGAYSLARSTMGQMAVRVALQCSEADAHLILSDERNMAARFLSRPGEAIYNDQNGLLAGNHPFQVVWLPEAKRIEYLRQVEKIYDESAASGEAGQRALTTIVFEGNQPADPADNRQLRAALDAPPRGGATPQQAWLGAAVAIKEPTCSTFARHAGSNLLVVGSWEESALGVLTNAVIALAAQDVAPTDHQAGTRFYILDGTRPDAAESGAWQRIAAALPQRIAIAGPRDGAAAIAEVAAELARRESAADDQAPPIYLVIYNGGRFRDLRRNDDDFSFSTDPDKPPSPDKQWAEILRNGPAWGVHTLLWCDSYNNVSRLLDRMALREFDLRVAFQMGAADSASLLDNPAASKLRQHRGLFASEDLGTLEKFRPYGPPTDAWLEHVGQAIAARGNS